MNVGLPITLPPSVFSPASEDQGLTSSYLFQGGDLDLAHHSAHLLPKRPLFFPLQCCCKLDETASPNFGPQLVVPADIVIR